MSQPLPIPTGPAASSSVSPRTKSSSCDLSPSRFRLFPVSRYSVSWVRCCARGAIPVLRASLQEQDSPVSLHLQPISTDTQFDRVVADPVLVVWMATWCRKCIYLKPKLDKLAAHYYPRLQFYSIDVNTISHKLVAHAGVTKMPTIQLWKGGKKQAEVIGGHKAYLVINEIQEMIENECTI